MAQIESSENVVGGFKLEYDFEKRSEVAFKIRSKYPDRIPVILEKVKSSAVPYCSKRKFLLPADLTLHSFELEIRKHMPELDSRMTLFLFMENNLPEKTALVSELYSKYKDEDGFLYVAYSGESTFGNL